MTRIIVALVANDAGIVGALCAESEKPAGQFSCGPNRSAISN